MEVEELVFKNLYKLWMHIVQIKYQILMQHFYFVDLINQVMEQ